mmetsp:Transcript_15834/g.36229  ORF Transcript_15834/g.36229 Transcript_15834/m.36229 type:complete len:262 (-) Transcript_15834:69-854(-)
MSTRTTPSRGGGRHLADRFATCFARLGRVSFAVRTATDKVQRDAMAITDDLGRCELESLAEQLRLIVLQLKLAILFSELGVVMKALLNRSRGLYLLAHLIFTILGRVEQYNHALRGPLQQHLGQRVARHHRVVSSLGTSRLVLCKPLQHVPQARFLVELDGNAILKRDGHAPVKTHLAMSSSFRALSQLLPPARREPCEQTCGRACDVVRGTARWPGPAARARTRAREIASAQGRPESRRDSISRFTVAAYQVPKPQQINS